MHISWRAFHLLWLFFHNRQVFSLDEILTVLAIKICNLSYIITMIHLCARRVKWGEQNWKFKWVSKFGGRGWLQSFLLVDWNLRRELGHLNTPSSVFLTHEKIKKFWANYKIFQYSQQNPTCKLIHARNKRFCYMSFLFILWFHGIAFMFLILMYCNETYYLVL